MAVRRIFKPIQLKIETIKDEDVKKKLSDLYTRLEAERTLEVQANREAAKAYYEAQKFAATAVTAKAKTETLQVEFLEQASQYFPLVAQEASWVPFRNEKGEIVIESIFTRRDQRNAMRVEKAHMEAAAGGGADFTKMFEEPPDDEDKEGRQSIGFGPAIIEPVIETEESSS